MNHVLLTQNERGRACEWLACDPAIIYFIIAGLQAPKVNLEPH